MPKYDKFSIFVIFHFFLYISRCFIFRINHENTNQFKEIGPILEKMIFCSKHIEDQLKSLFGEKIDLRDNTYCHMVSGLLEHFSKIQQINSEQISSKCQELEKVRHSYEKIIKENSDMKRKISDYEQQTMKMEEIHKKLLDEKVLFYFIFFVNKNHFPIEP